MKNSIDNKKTPEELRRELEVHDLQPNMKALRGEDPVVNNMHKSYKEWKQKKQKVK